MVSRPLVMSQSKATIQVSQQPENSPDQSYPIGSIVCLRCCQNKQYTVLEVQEDVDLGDISGHIRNPNGGRQHYYKLRTESDGVAHWWHHQLELVF